MAAETLCQYLEFRLCKYFENWRNINDSAVWEDVDCEMSSCFKRHPRLCKYNILYHRCKFTPCSYRHDDFDTADVKELKNAFRFQDAEN